MEFEGEHKNKVDTSDSGFFLYVTLKELSVTGISITEFTIILNILELILFHTIQMLMLI